MRLCRRAPQDGGDTRSVKHLRKRVVDFVDNSFWSTFNFKRYDCKHIHSVSKSTRCSSLWFPTVWKRKCQVEHHAFVYKCYLLNTSPQKLFGVIFGVNSLQSWASGAMDNASDFGSGGSRFKSWQAQTSLN